MDDRFPKWLRWIVGKFEFIGIPNLAPLLCAMAVLAYAAKFMGTTPIDRFMFDPVLIRQGEWWRLFAFPILEGNDNPIFFIFYVLYIYWIVGTLESHWGPGPTTFFILLGYISAIAAAIITNQPVSIWFYVLENVSLAFGTLFPDIEFYIYFILPVKAKWLAMLAGALLIFQFVFGGTAAKIFILLTMLPYLIFFTPVLISNIRNRRRIAENRKRFDPDMWR